MNESGSSVEKSADPNKLIWILENTESELWKEPPDPVLDAVAAIVTVKQPNGVEP